ncbi:MAG: hypothetical protein ACPG6B_03535 [Oceanihabitans sp.]
MYKTFLTSFIFALISSFLQAQEPNTKAPVLKLDLEINGEKYEILDGESIVVNGNTIKVNSSNFLSFDYSALKFDYPKHFAFEYDEDFGYKNWTLDGNDFVIMYFEYTEKIALDLFINQMVNQFGKENCNVVDKKIQLGNQTLIGKRINVDIVGVKLTYDMYKIEASDNNTHFISFQDSKNDDGSDSQEGINTLELINKTFKVK